LDGLETGHYIEPFIVGGSVLLRSLTIFSLILILMMPAGGVAQTATTATPVTDNPLINVEANRGTGYLPIPGGIVNILLMGIDSDEKDYTYRVEESHTDTMIILAINLKENKADLISVPRDTMAYVPGTRGVYKLNCAINVGGTRVGKPARSPEGFKAACETISWVLGGIRIDNYMAVDMEAMAAIGNAIGGIDFDVIMSYSSLNRRYKAGMQHLDGQGIVDYFQARKNATVNSGSDLARTGRQRALLSAIFQKLLSNQKLLLQLIQGTSEIQAIRSGFFTDFGAMDIPRMLQIVLTLTAGMNADNKGSSIQTHVISGTYRNAFGNWKFTFTDQDNRKAVIKQVYGVDVPELKYVSYSYAQWLYTFGFKAIRHLSAAEGIRVFMDSNPDKLSGSDNLSAAVDSFNAAFRDTQEAFILAAQTMEEEQTRLMSAATSRLNEAGNTLARLIAYPKKGGKVSWKLAKYHDDDKLINEVYVNFR
jgi:LCP family protein required for cell wall assembly